MAKTIMIQGTMSNAGKSLLVAGLCRIFAQDGYRVAPFKSQNMALNSFITKEGLEMGRAQVMQAEAAGVTPSVCMNPILLKPTNDIGSQVIVNGKVLGNMNARDYFAFKRQLIPDIMAAYHHLEETADIIVIEGAGSPAEINLKKDDIVNMGMAELVDAPVLLAGDIDRGGVFAQLYGTYALLEEKEQRRIRGMIINKFRGDQSLLDSGIDMLFQRTGVPVVGVVPYMNLSLEDEDSLSQRFVDRPVDAVDLAVIRFPRISNFTDFSAFERLQGVSVRYVDRPEKLGQPDMVILPGSKNTMGDLKWMRQSGMEAAIKKYAGKGIIFGICGGYQMLGSSIADPMGVEDGGQMTGMELLPMDTILQGEKITRQVQGTFLPMDGLFRDLADKELHGYEIHMGRSCFSKDAHISSLTWIKESDGALRQAGVSTPQIYGSYVHGIFDGPDIAETMVCALADRKGIRWKGQPTMDYATFKEQQYDLLADCLRQSLDMNYIYSCLGGKT